MSTSQRLPRTVLIIEDSDIDRLIVSRIAARAWPDVRLLHAADGQEAIEVLDADTDPSPELILLDINMPRVDGHEFLRRYFAERDLECPAVVILTSSSLEADRVRTRPYTSVKDYLVKPVRADDLRQIGASFATWTGARPNGMTDSFATAHHR